MTDKITPALEAIQDNIKPVVNTLPDWMQSSLFIQLSEAVTGIVLILFFFDLFSRLLSGKIQTSNSRYRFRKAIGLFSYGVIIVFLISLFSENLKQVSVFLGIVGAGIAFALQEVIASIAGWIAIAFGQFYRPGDRVQLGGIMGDVIDISILRSTLMECGGWVHGDQYNGRIVRIANSFVFKEPVFNYSADFSFVWDEIVFPIKHGSDRAWVKEMLLRVLREITATDIRAAETSWKRMTEKYMIEHAKVEPSVTLVATDNWLEFTLRYVVDYKKRRSRKDQLFSGILDEIDQNPEKAGIASSTLHLVETPAFDIRLKKGSSESADDLQESEKQEKAIA